eukprot:14984857-Alexandrium_andersonii.AAC.1
MWAVAAPPRRLKQCPDQGCSGIAVGSPRWVERSSLGARQPSPRFGGTFEPAESSGSEGFGCTLGVAE